jgi:hypothetical protein
MHRPACRGLIHRSAELAPRASSIDASAPARRVDASLGGAGSLNLLDRCVCPRTPVRFIARPMTGRRTDLPGVGRRKWRFRGPGPAGALASRVDVRPTRDATTPAIRREIALPEASRRPSGAFWRACAVGDRGPPVAWRPPRSPATSGRTAVSPSASSDAGRGSWSGAAPSCSRRSTARPAGRRGHAGGGTPEAAAAHGGAGARVQRLGRRGSGAEPPAACSCRGSRRRRHGRRPGAMRSARYSASGSGLPYGRTYVRNRREALGQNARSYEDHARIGSAERKARPRLQRILRRGSRNVRV